MRRISRLVCVAILLLLAAVSAACSSLSAVPSSRMLAIYAGGVPGTTYATQALKWASQAGFQMVINYSAIDATPDNIRSYLNQAQQLGIKVTLSLKDLLGNEDLDKVPGDKAMHKQFGNTTSDQVVKIVREFGTHPAVWGFYISDELPAGPSDLSKRLPQLQERQSVIKALTTKPTLVTLYWSGPDAMYYSAVKAQTDNLAIDYYPWPENTTYGPVSAISTIGQTLHAVAGMHGWFVLQGFGWGDSRDPEGRKQGGFSVNAAPPNVDTMVSMAQNAVMHGAQNLIVYSYDDNMPSVSGEPGNPAQLAAITAAVGKIVHSSWWSE